MFNLIPIILGFHSQMNFISELKLQIQVMLISINMVHFHHKSHTPSVLCLAHEFARNYFFPCERPILSKPILLDSIGQDVHFDVYLECSQKKSWVS